MKNIPNFFTLLNLVFGCLAIVATLQNGLVFTPDIDGKQWIDIPPQIWMASLFIGLAAVVDFLDGFLARALKADSSMGKQLDSLADVVSFGVAPAMILYQFLRLSFAQQEDGLNISAWLLSPVFILPAAAAWRLARFNLDTSVSYGFKGMPVPAAGIFVASYPLIYWNVDQSWVDPLMKNAWFIYSTALGLSVLMVSQLPLMALKFRDYSFAHNKEKYILVILALVLVFLLKWLAIPAIIVAYVLLSLLFQKKQA